MWIYEDLLQPAQTNVGDVPSVLKKTKIKLVKNTDTCLVYTFLKNYNDERLTKHVTAHWEISTKKGL